jgi:quinol monooxygenase YgiN
MAGVKRVWMWVRCALEAAFVLQYVFRVPFIVRVCRYKLHHETLSYNVEWFFGMALGVNGVNALRVARERMAAMKRFVAMTCGCAVLVWAVMGLTRPARAQVDHRLARIAEIEIDPQQIEPYKAALREGMEAALRSEPGVLALYAVSVRDHPEQVRVFEVYASPAAYQSHLQTPHFKKYKSRTQGMVRSLKLIETDPISLISKSEPAK